MSSTASKSPSTIMSTPDFPDESPKPRIASGTLPLLAAQAPEFIPGEAYQLSFLNQLSDDQEGDRKTSDVSSDRDEMAEKKRRNRRHKKRPRVEKDAEKDTMRQQAIDEEWWSGDDIFVPELQGREDLCWSDGQI
ncbi:hypothetical protein DHEL01_v211462 [Diaporthe helianthi]|uniref:Uncharacterized protein n=1 Tax=Diaporthe helianthi TaxID=158607 RepID=A0A2P5HIT1_DIAHE|nr:hypothetical protein DHEL01_v211462 [Diaporthe helianthi]